MAGRYRRKDVVHRAGFTLGERLLRKLQLQASGRDPQWGDLLLDRGNARACRTLAGALQHHPATLFAGLPCTSSADLPGLEQHGYGEEQTATRFPHPTPHTLATNQRCERYTNSSLGTKAEQPKLSGQGRAASVQPGPRAALTRSWLKQSWPNPRSRMNRACSPLVSLPQASRSRPAHRTTLSNKHGCTRSGMECSARYLGVLRVLCRSFDQSRYGCLRCQQRHSLMPLCGLLKGICKCEDFPF